jgi:para-aminobenzoate synthetase component 1
MEIVTSKTRAFPTGVLRVSRIPLEPAPKPEDVFCSISREPHPVWLDSSDPSHRSSRFSYIGWDPWGRLAWREGESVWQGDHGRAISLGGDPFEALRIVLRAWRQEECGASAPFQGGAVGYLAYELGGCLEKLPPPPTDDLGFPGMQMGIYNLIYAYEHAEEQGTLFVGEIEADPVRNGRDYVRRVRHRFLHRLESSVISEDGDGGFSPVTVQPECDTAHHEYLEMVQAGRDYIARGDIFQVNLSQRFSWPITLPHDELYLRLRAHHEAPFSAYLGVDSQRSVLSVSPELFLSVRGRHVITHPIKGTRPRSPMPSEDERLKRELLASEKDRAELVMIVDLERNDLGRVCEFGSVRVNNLAALQSFATVHHLVAEVEGTLRRDADVVDLLRASFPGGSVTGAPKIRAMEIIAEQETTARSVYTGSVGWIGLNGDADFNIAIRTVLCNGPRAVYRVGGAIVADSDPQAEYEETLHKGRALYETLSRS